MSDIIYDGDFTVASPVGPILTENPFDFQPHIRIFRQRFWQLTDNFRELPALSPFPGWREDVAALTGYYTVNYRAGTPVALGVGATAAQLLTALESLSSIGTGKILSATGTFDNGFSVEFYRNTGIKPNNHLIKVNTNQIAPPYKANVRIIRTTPRVIQHILFEDANTTDAGAYLVSESPRQEVGGGVVEWERAYANIPDPYVEYDAYNYQRQTVQTIRVPWNGTTDVFGNFQGSYRTFINLAEWSEPLTAKVMYSFCRKNALGTNQAPFRIPYRIIHYKDSFSNEVVYQVGEWGVAEPTDAKRWLGNIWRVRNVIVNPY